MSDLKCYRVGDHDYYAAHDADEAVKLHYELSEVDDEDAVEITGLLLDTPWNDEETKKVLPGTLRSWLAEATEPKWLSGTE